MEGIVAVVPHRWDSSHSTSTLQTRLSTGWFIFLFPELYENLIGTKFDRDEKIKAEAVVRLVNMNNFMWTVFEKTDERWVKRKLCWKTQMLTIIETV